MTTTTATTPHLFRCRTCLETYAFEERYPGITKCVCGGTFSYTGQVNDGRVIYTATAPACDYRCTDAIGKSCICQCGGVNHGSHRERTIRRDVGAEPQIADFADAEACQLRARELLAGFVALKDRTIAEVGRDTYEAYSRGAWIERGAWDKLNAWSRGG